MTNQEVLEKAIQKAIDGGYMSKTVVPVTGHWCVSTGDEFGSIHDGLMVKFFDEVCNVEMIIFNHDFAKSFFGTNEVCFSCGLENKHDPYCAERTSYDEAWKYHLREMAIYENPIKYLGDHI